MASSPAGWLVQAPAPLCRLFRPNALAALAALVRLRAADQEEWGFPDAGRGGQASILQCLLCIGQPSRGSGAQSASTNVSYRR